MHLQSQLLERQAELAALDAAIDAARRGGGRLVVVEGPAGIGKSRLLAVAGHRAQERGMAVLRARGGELEREFAYGIVRQLFEPTVTRAPAEDRKELLSGLAGLTAPLFAADSLVASAPAAGEEAGFAVLHGLYWLTVNLAERQPLALVVDDLHWGDGPSLRWLTYLVRRIDGLHVLVLVSIRPDEPDVHAPLPTDVLPEPAGIMLRPAPLSLAAVTELVWDALGPDAAGEFCAACHQASGGNPFLLRELLSVLAADGVRPTAEAIGQVRRMSPQRVARAVQSRLARLPEEATRLAKAVAVLGDEADLGHAAALAGLEREQAARAVTMLGRAQLLRPEPPCRFVHPVVRAAIYDDLPLSDRERAHAQAAQLLAEHGAPAEQVCAHLLLAPPAGQGFVVAELRQAAQQALAQGAADSAAAHLRRALQEPPGPTERAEVLYELGSAERLLHAPTAVHHLGEALALTGDRQRRGQVALALGQTMFFSGQGRQAVDVLDKAIADLGDHHVDLRHRLQAALLNVAVEDPTLFPLAADRLQDLRQQLPDPSAGGRALLAILAYQQARAGTGRADAIALAKQAMSGGLGTADEGATTFGFAANVLAHADQFDAAAMICEQALADARARAHCSPSPWPPCSEGTRPITGARCPRPKPTPARPWRRPWPTAWPSARPMPPPSWPRRSWPAVTLLGRPAPSTCSGSAPRCRTPATCTGFCTAAPACASCRVGCEMGWPTCWSSAAASRPWAATTRRSFPGAPKPPSPCCSSATGRRHDGSPPRRSSSPAAGTRPAPSAGRSGRPGPQKLAPLAWSCCGRQPPC